MKWDYQTNRPIEGTYKHRKYDKETLLSSIPEYIYPLEDVTAHLDAVNWNLERFFLEKIDDIQDPSDLFPQLSYWQEIQSAYWYDMDSSHLHLTDIPDDWTWGGVPEKINQGNILARLFFCETEEEIWDMVRDLPYWVGNNLLECFYGCPPKRKWARNIPVGLKDLEKAARLKDYLYGPLPQNSRQVGLGSTISIAADYEYSGIIVGLEENHLAVQLKSRLGSYNTTQFHVSPYEKGFGEITEGGRYFATEVGIRTAIQLLINVGIEERALLEDRSIIEDMIAEYNAEKGPDYIPGDMCPKLKRKYFPNLESIEFTIELVEKLEKYQKGDL